MGQITSSVGIISGINTGAIIDELISLDQAPITILQSQVTSNNNQTQAYNSLQSQLITLQGIGKSLELPQTFQAAATNSSNPSVLTATAGLGAPQGSYQFQVAQLVSAQQSISNGFTSTNAPLQAGTISIEMGGGSLAAQTPLSDLNGGAGISRGQFRITDSSGNTDVVDTSTAVTLDDVVNQINNSLNVNVHASIANDHLVLTDGSSGSGTMTVQDLGGGTSAQSLGIAGNASGSTLTGSSINYLSTNTALSALNDGRGVRTTSAAADFAITTADGSTTNIKVGSAQTIGDLINAINTAGSGKVKASLGTGAQGITLTDLTGTGGAFSVTDLNGSNAADDLGIKKTGSGGVINGSPVIAGLDTVLVSSLNGGSGLSLGQISITNRNNHQTTVNLAGATTVQGILDAINNSAGVGVKASLNSAGNGIQLQDTTGGTANLVIGDAGGGTTAENLGLAGTFSPSQTVANSGDLHLQYVTQNTLLSNYNGGKGVSTGSFKIVNSAGNAATVDLSQGTFNTIGDVISAINAQNIGVTASINSAGNGLLLTDTAGGGGHLNVTDVTGTSASDLNIAGTAAANTIDGALKKTIQVTSSDTLSTLLTKFQQLDFGVAANIINDGSNQAPNRLSLTSLNSGTAGGIIVDGGTTGLNFSTLVQAQNAAVFVGGTGSSQPLLVTSSTNQVTNIIPGVTLSLQSASSSPVTLSITRDGSAIAKQLQTFTDTFNSLVDSLNTFTQYNTSTNQGGLLLGDPTAQNIESQMYTVFQGVVSSAGQYRTLGDVGLSLGDGAKITFDANTFNAAFAANPDAVSTLFSQTSTGLGSIIDKSMTSLVDPVTGAITIENQTLANETQDFQTQITQLNAILAQKKQNLTDQFNNMESVLAGLQSQQAALSSFTGISTKPSDTSSVGSSASSSDSSSSSGSSSSTSGTSG